MHDGLVVDLASWAFSYLPFPGQVFVLVVVSTFSRAPSLFATATFSPLSRVGSPVVLFATLASTSHGFPFHVEIEELEKLASLYSK